MLCVNCVHRKVIRNLGSSESDERSDSEAIPPAQKSAGNGMNTVVVYVGKLVQWQM